jgi:hypothetical protein
VSKTVRRTVGKDLYGYIQYLCFFCEAYVSCLYRRCIFVYNSGSSGCIVCYDASVRGSG